MIKANELRIGNFVQFNGEATRVIAVMPKVVHVELRDLATGKSPNEIEPIPLAEEWLLKFGFKKKENTERTIIDFHIGDNTVTNDWLFTVTLIKWNATRSELFYRNGFHKLEYVHQLQNLFFALGGTELILIK